MAWGTRLVTSYIWEGQMEGWIRWSGVGWGEVGKESRGWEKQWKKERKEQAEKRPTHSPIEHIPVFPAPLVLVVQQVKSTKLAPVTLKHGEQSISESLPETIEVNLGIALVEPKEERSTGHLALDGVLQQVGEEK